MTSSQLEMTVTLTLSVSVLTLTLGGSFLLGYNLGNINGYHTFLMPQFIRDSHAGTFGATISKSDANIVWAVTVSVYSVGGCVGGLISGWAADRFGRKPTLVANNVLVLFATLSMSLAQTLNFYLMLTFGRLIIGFSCGLITGIVPMYLTEISPVEWRGVISSLHQVFVAVGRLASQIVGFPILLAQTHTWPWIFALSAFPALFQLCTLPFCPQSPKFLLAFKEDDAAAEDALRSLRGQQDVAQEMQHVRRESDALLQIQRVRMKEMFSRKDLRWPLTIASVLILSRQLCGMNGIMFYSTVIFKDAGLVDLEPYFANIGITVTNVLQTMLSAWLVDRPKFGRRTLQLGGLGGMFVSSLAVVISFIIEKSGQGDDRVQSSTQWASLLIVYSIFCFVLSFSFGPSSIPWFYVSEIFASGTRAHANSIVVFLNWFSSFIVTLTFPLLRRLIGHYLFLIYTVLLAFFWLFTFIYVPETKGQSVDDIVLDLERHEQKQK